MTQMRLPQRYQNVIAQKRSAAESPPTPLAASGLPFIPTKVDRRSYLLFKRTLDLTLATAGLVALSPMLLMVGIAIKLDSPGSVFFKQTRVGRNGRTFGSYKFRSM